MTGAMKAVADGLFGVNKAADEFGVPRLTIKDRLSGKVVHGTRSGPTPYLSGVEKDKLVKFLLTSTDIGLPKTRVEVNDIGLFHLIRGPPLWMIFHCLSQGVSAH